MTAQYSQNLDNKNQQFNRLSEDACYNQQKEDANAKKLKFITTNYVDLLDANQTKNFFGMTLVDGIYIPSQYIDNYSQLLNGQVGGILTNCNASNELGQLPVNVGYRGQLSHGPIQTEDTMRNLLVPKKNACLPKDTNFQNRSFSIFNSNIETPDATKSVETPNIGFSLGRNGQPTRFLQIYDNKMQKKSSQLDIQGFNVSNY